MLRRPGAGRDPDAAAQVLRDAVRRLSFNHQLRWLWVPTCAGTTRNILAAPYARALPETYRPLQTEDAGKTGCALHPRSRVQCAQKSAHTSIQVQRRTPGLPCAMALRLMASSPRRTALLPPLRPGKSDASQVHGRQQRGVRTTRLCRTLRPRSSGDNLHVHRSPPNVRDDGRRPSDQDGMAKHVPVICHS